VSVGGAVGGLFRFCPLALTAGAKTRKTFPVVYASCRHLKSPSMYYRLRFTKPLQTIPLYRQTNKGAFEITPTGTYNRISASQCPRPFVSIGRTVTAKLLRPWHNQTPSRQSRSICLPPAPPAPAGPAAFGGRLRRSCGASAPPCAAASAACGGGFRRRSA
jgi:hypothetical protein